MFGEVWMKFRAAW